MVSHCSLILACCLLAVLSSKCAQATKSDPAQSYDILYDQAVEAYLEEDWDKCVRLMNEAIEDYHFYVDSQVGCRLNCQKIVSVNAMGKQISPNNLEDMKFFEKMVKQTLCLLKCKKNLLKNRAEIVSRQIMESFEYFRPYDYLQLCYFKVKIIYQQYDTCFLNHGLFLQTNDLIRAASSAYTFLTLNPDHEVMKANLRYYINDMKIEPDYVINLEAKPYVEFYIRGSESYKKEEFDRTANYFELSLTEYLIAENECRAMCEGPFDQGWFPDFVSSVASKYFIIFEWLKTMCCALAFDVIYYEHMILQIIIHSHCDASKSVKRNYATSMEKFMKI